MVGIHDGRPATAGEVACGASLDVRRVSEVLEGLAGRRVI
jgi:hypothetical protein